MGCITGCFLFPFESHLWFVTVSTSEIMSSFLLFLFVVPHCGAASNQKTSCYSSWRIKWLIESGHAGSLETVCLALAAVPLAAGAPGPHSPRDQPTLSSVTRTLLGTTARFLLFLKNEASLGGTWVYYISGVLSTCSSAGFSAASLRRG